MLNNDILIVCILNNELNTAIIVLKPARSDRSIQGRVEEKIWEGKIRCDLTS
jgi:hypothetical protein